MFKSSYRRCSIKKLLLKILQISQENTCVRVSFLKKLQAESCNLILKNRIWHRCFSVNFVRFLRTSILQNTSRWLPLNVQQCISFPRIRTMLKDSYYFLKVVEIGERNWKLLTNKVLEKSKLLWCFDFHKVLPYT